MDWDDRLRSVIYPLVFVGIIAVLWLAAWAEARADALPGYDPGENTWYMAGNGKTFQRPAPPMPN